MIAQLQPNDTDTPMLRQFKEIKAKHTDAILFFRLGDFYEMFLEDATIASQELDLTLTGRGKKENRIPMCGIPFHAAENYINKLVDRGYKVAICEQVEDPNAHPGLTKRDVVRVITPATNMTQGGTIADTNTFIVAINSIEKSGQFGVSFADCSTGEFCITLSPTEKEVLQLIDTLNPKELLLPTNMSLALPDTILINPYFAVPIDQAKEALCRHFNIASLTGYGVSDTSYALPAALSILQYLKTTQKAVPSHMTRIKNYETHDYLSIDRVSQQNLELISHPQQKEKKATLFGILHHTKTAMGSRKLKRLIVSPYTNKAQIDQRLDAVEQFRTDLLSREECREQLAKIQDIERLATRIVVYQNNPKALIALKDSLKALLELGPIIQHLDSDLCQKHADYLKDINNSTHPLMSLINYLETAIIDDPPTHIRHGKFIKEGFSTELDNLCQSFKSIRSWIQTLEAKEREKFQIKSLKVGFNKVFGYYIEIPNGYKDAIPEHYSRKQTLTNAERYITPELKEKENILLTGEEKQKELEQTLFKDIVAYVQSMITPLQKVADTIADIDTLQALGTVAQKYDYVRPDILEADEVYLEIQQGRHPVLEQNNQHSFIPNDILMTENKHRTILITGPNMAGKSTVMRQVALIAIMAHMGSFVPAKKVSLSLIDKVFTRIGTHDNLYLGQSTFMVEMLETATILNNATKNSLILLDEVGRGTSTFDGLSLACAITTYIHTHIGARTLFATHYHEMTHLEDRFQALSNFNMEIIEHQKKLVFNYLFVPGTADKSYGIHVGQMAGLPQEVISDASTLLDGFEAHGVKFLDRQNSIETDDNLNQETPKEAIQTNHSHFTTEDIETSVISATDTLISATDASFKVENNQPTLF